MFLAYPRTYHTVLKSFTLPQFLLCSYYLLLSQLPCSYILLHLWYNSFLVCTVTAEGQHLVLQFSALVKLVQKATYTSHSVTIMSQTTCISVQGTIIIHVLRQKLIFLPCLRLGALTYLCWTMSSTTTSRASLSCLFTEWVSGRYKTEAIKIGELINIEFLLPPE